MARTNGPGRGADSGVSIRRGVGLCGDRETIFVANEQQGRRRIPGSGYAAPPTARREPSTASSNGDRKNDEGPYDMPGMPGAS